MHSPSEWARYTECYFCLCNRLLKSQLWHSNCPKFDHGWRCLTWIHENNYNEMLLTNINLTATQVSCRKIDNLIVAHPHFLSLSFFNWIKVDGLLSKSKYRFPLALFVLDICGKLFLHIDVKVHSFSCYS